MRKIPATETNAPHLVFQSAVSALRPARKPKLKLRRRVIFSLKPVECVFNGVQLFPGRKPLELWTVKGSLPIGVNSVRKTKNLRGSTVTAQTLKQLGCIPVSVCA